MTTFFFSKIGMEDYTNEMLEQLLVKEVLVEYLTEPHVEVMSIKDAGGNEMWSVSVTLGFEDDLYARVRAGGRPYEKGDE